MDKLKQNAFTIILSVGGVVALALLWFLVLSPLMASSEGSVGGSREKLTKLLGTYKQLADKKRTPVLPTAENRKADEKDAKSVSAEVVAAKNFYEGRSATFSEFETDAPGAEESVLFKGWYESTVDKLRADYRAKFLPSDTAAAPVDGAVPATAAPAAAATKAKDDALAEEPTVVPEAKVNGPEDVKRTMKEFWILKDVFEGATGLSIAGLKSIGFPARSGERAARGEKEKDKVDSAPKDHAWMKAIVTVDLPLTKLEPLVAKLLASERVPFRLDSIEVTRPINSHVSKVVVVIDSSKKEAEKPAGDGDEPVVTAQIGLSAMEWIGDTSPSEKSADASRKEKSGE